MRFTKDRLTCTLIWFTKDRLTCILVRFTKDRLTCILVRFTKDRLTWVRFTKDRLTCILVRFTKDRLTWVRFTKDRLTCILVRFTKDRLTCILVRFTFTKKDCQQKSCQNKTDHSCEYRLNSIIPFEHKNFSPNISLNTLILRFAEFAITTTVWTSLILLCTLVTSQDHQMENRTGNMMKLKPTLSEQYLTVSTYIADDIDSTFPTHVRTSTVTETSASEMLRKSLQEEVTAGYTSSPESIKLEPSITHVSTLSNRTGDRRIDKSQVLPSSSESTTWSQPHSFAFSTPYQTLNAFETDMLLEAHERSDSVNFSAEPHSTVGGTTSTHNLHLFSRYCQLIFITLLLVTEYVAVFFTDHVRGTREDNGAWFCSRGDGL